MFKVNSRMQFIFIEITMLQIKSAPLQELLFERHLTGTRQTRMYNYNSFGTIFGIIFNLSRKQYIL